MRYILEVFFKAMTALGLRRTYTDVAFSAARSWSNTELAKFSSLFDGTVINVSAWEDKDKEGRTYKSYFSNCEDYFTSNFGTDQGVIQGGRTKYFLIWRRSCPNTWLDGTASSSIILAWSISGTFRPHSTIYAKFRPT